MNDDASTCEIGVDFAFKKRLIPPDFVKTRLEWIHTPSVILEVA